MKFNMKNYFKMKKLFILFAAALAVASCAKEPKFVITGTIDGARGWHGTSPETHPRRIFCNRLRCP